MKFEIVKDTFNRDNPQRLYFMILAKNERYEARFFHVGDDYWDIRARAENGTEEDRKAFFESGLQAIIDAKKGPIELDYMGGKVVIKPSFYGFPFIYPNEAYEMAKQLSIAAEDAADLQTLVEEYFKFD